MLTLKERLQATILIGNGVGDSVEYLRREIYNIFQKLYNDEVKNIKHFVSSTFKLEPKMCPLRPTTCSSLDECRNVG